MVQREVQRDAGDAVLLRPDHALLCLDDAPPDRRVQRLGVTPHGFAEGPFLTQFAARAGFLHAQTLQVIAQRHVVRGEAQPLRHLVGGEDSGFGQTPEVLAVHLPNVSGGLLHRAELRRGETLAHPTEALLRLLVRDARARVLPLRTFRDHLVALRREGGLEVDVQIGDAHAVVRQQLHGGLHERVVDVRVARHDAPIGERHGLRDILVVRESRSGDLALRRDERGADVDEALGDELGERLALALGELPMRLVLTRADGLAQEVRRLAERALRHHRLTLALGVEIGLRLRGEVGLRLPLTRQVLAELPFPLRLAEPPT